MDTRANINYHGAPLIRRYVCLLSGKSLFSLDLAIGFLHVARRLFPLPISTRRTVAYGNIEKASTLLLNTCNFT